MDWIRQWALTFCIGAIMTSILQGILPEKGTFSGIKLVLTLYILITLLSPLKSFSVSQVDLRLDMQEIELPQQDTQQAILERAQSQLEAVLQKALKDAGISAESVKLTLTLQQDGGVTADAVEVKVMGEQDGEKIEQTVAEALGCSTQVTVTAADGMDEER